MDSGAMSIAIVLYIVGAGCVLVGMMISLQQSPQPDGDSNRAPTARVRLWMRSGAILFLVGAVLMAVALL